MLLSLLRAGAEARPDHPLVITAGGTTTWTAAADRAGAIARDLRHRALERVAGQLDDIPALVALLAGASAAGTEVCTYSPRLTAPEVADLAAAFDHHVVVTDRPLEADGVTALPIDELGRDDGEVPSAEASPVLILTTGTTGRPKGARHDWRRLVAAVRAGTPEPDARWLLAYNVNQFAGVQVLLQVLTTGTTLVVPATTSPRDVAEAMATHGVTHASGTPTFWRFFCNQVSPADAAGIPLRQITLGGEATDDQLLDELRKRFPDARISHVYAATEFGSAVSVRDGKYGLPRSVLDRADDADIRFRVVDGELHVQSKVGMLGYYGDDDAGDGWRPTGDLVEEIDDRLIFVGRTSEIINVGGVKVHPLPLESAITGVAGVAMARVFGRPNPMTGAIVAVEVVVADGFDPKAVDAAIREACAGFPAAARPRRVRFVDHLETRENKVVRRAGGDDTVGGPETT